MLLGLVLQLLCDTGTPCRQYLQTAVFIFTSPATLTMSAVLTQHVLDAPSEYFLTNYFMLPTLASVDSEETG